MNIKHYQSNSFMKLISDIQKAATSELVAAQNEAWQSLVCDGVDDAIRVYLCAVEKELKRRISQSKLKPIMKLLSLDDAVQRWNEISTEDDKRVVEEIAKEIKSYVKQNQAFVDFETIAKYLASRVNHGIYLDDVEVALAKLISRQKIIRNGNSYRLI